LCPFLPRAVLMCRTLQVFTDCPTYDEKVDLYSLAMIMWYIITGRNALRRTWLGWLRVALSAQ